ncbi:MAG: hypothetical protein EOO75_06305 [Myxococcales bacterium]|nr:MAG: hypothetical protein EOO75_06305 [Myxococcales bacterium]
MDGSLAGVVVAQTRLAHVDGEKGLALVRGYELPELAARCTYEQVAHLVLAGELPTAAEQASFAGRLAGELTAAERQAAAALGAALPPATALAGAMVLLDDEGGDDLRAAAERALGRVPALVAAVAGQPAPARAWSYARRALGALGATRTDAPAVRALEVLLSLEAEHGLSASTFAGRVAASSGAGCGLALAAAVATLTGPRHGGATSEARALLLEARDGGDVPGLVRRAREQRRRLAGFGHRIYKVPDPRVPPLRAAIESLGEVPLLPVALALESEVASVYGARGVYANIDLFGALLLDALGVAPASYVAAFALGLAPGWLAHWIEQRQTGRLIRPDSEYTGPPRRPVPHGP